MFISKQQPKPSQSILLCSMQLNIMGADVGHELYYYYYYYYYYLL